MLIASNFILGFHSAPEHIGQLAWEITALKDNTSLVIEKTEGQIYVRKERL